MDVGKFKSALLSLNRKMKEASLIKIGFCNILFLKILSWGHNWLHNFSFSFRTECNPQHNRQRTATHCLLYYDAVKGFLENDHFNFSASDSFQETWADTLEAGHSPVHINFREEGLYLYLNISPNIKEKAWKHWNRISCSRESALSCFIFGFQLSSVLQQNEQ